MKKRLSVPPTKNSLLSMLPAATLIRVSEEELTKYHKPSENYSPEAAA